MFLKPKVATRDELPGLLPKYKKLKAWKKRQDFVKYRVQEEDKDLFYDLVKDSYFVPENRDSEERVFTSPSGKYALRIVRFSTGKGTWSFSEGAVFDAKSGKLIERIRRNYSAFPFCWVEDHPNGHDYLIGGEDYQGQTVIELDTGKKKSALSKGAAQGHGFCWVTIKSNETGTRLVVDGCYWACPYEILVVDFSDPMSLSWPQIYRSDQSLYASVEGLEGNVLKLKGDRYKLKEYDEEFWEGDHQALKKLHPLVGQFVDELKEEDRKLLEEVEDETDLCYDDFCEEIEDMEFSVVLEDYSP